MLQGGVAEQDTPYSLSRAWPCHVSVRSMSCRVKSASDDEWHCCSQQGCPCPILMSDITCECPVCIPALYRENWAKQADRCGGEINKHLA